MQAKINPKKAGMTFLNLFAIFFNILYFRQPMHAFPPFPFVFPYSLKGIFIILSNNSVINVETSLNLATLSYQNKETLKDEVSFGSLYERFSKISAISTAYSVRKKVHFKIDEHARALLISVRASEALKRICSSKECIVNRKATWYLPH